MLGSSLKEVVQILLEIWHIVSLLGHYYRRRQWHPTPILLPGKSHGRRSLEAAVHGAAEGRTRLRDYAFTMPASKHLSISRQKLTAEKTGTKGKDGSWCYMEPEHGLTIFLCLMVSWSLKHFPCLPLLILLEDWLQLSRGQCLFFPGTW